MALSPAVQAMLDAARLRASTLKPMEQQLAEAMQQTPAIIPEANEASPALEVSKGIQFNPEQLEAIEACCNFENVVICGSAGTGKTTIMHTVASKLSRDARMPLLERDTGSEYTTTLRKGTPGIVAVSFTNTAVGNINRALQGVIPCVTIHKLLQYAPVSYDNAGITSRRFEPTYTALNPLPNNLRTIIVEESGIVSITLFEQLLKALPDPRNVQFIFLGDLFQLDPPYDPAILGYSLISEHLRKIELTRVYRQAVHSPVLQLVLDIKERLMIPSNKMADKCISNEHGSVTIKPWKHRLDEFKATLEAAKFLRKEWEAGRYFPESSQVIIPFNKRFGSTELNLLIADWFGKARNAEVHEIIAGYDRKYLAIGDCVMVSKVRGVITKIEKNPAYLGTISPQPSSTKLDRFGYNDNRALEEASLLENDADAHDEIDRLMAASLADNEDRMRSSSHLVTVQLGQNDELGGSVVLSSGGDFSLNKFDFSHCMTCYKAQGSEWERVYVFTHKSHAVALCNEFFYTAFSRARKHLTVICEPDHLGRVMTKQSIAGNNWQEKSAYFKRNTAKLGALARVSHFILGSNRVS